MFGRSRPQGPSSSRRRGRIGIAISAAVLIIGVFIAIPATATPVKYYTPTISPTCRDVSSTGPLAITLTNNMAPGGQGFGSAQITIPSGWSVNLTGSSFTFANPSTPRNWRAAGLTGTSSNIIQLSSNSSADLVPPQGSITFTFSSNHAAKHRKPVLAVEHCGQAVEQLPRLRERLHLQQEPQGGAARRQRLGAMQCRACCQQREHHWHSQRWQHTDGPLHVLRRGE